MTYGRLQGLASLGLLLGLAVGSAFVRPQDALASRSSYTQPRVANMAAEGTGGGGGLGPIYSTFVGDMLGRSQTPVQKPVPTAPAQVPTAQPVQIRDFSKPYSDSCLLQEVVVKPGDTVSGYCSGLVYGCYGPYDKCIGEEGVLAHINQEEGRSLEAGLRAGDTVNLYIQTGGTGGPEEEPVVVVPAPQATRSSEQNGLYFASPDDMTPGVVGDIEGTSFDNSGYSWIFGITSRDKLDPNLLNKEIYKDGIPIGGLEDVEIGNRRFTVCWRYDTEVPERPLIVFGNRHNSIYQPDTGFVRCREFVSNNK